MGIRVKNFEPAEGLWWVELYRVKDRVCLELVGADHERYRPFLAALETIERSIGLPQASLQKQIEKIRPDTKQEKWLKGYLKVLVPLDQVEGLEPPGGG